MPGQSEREINLEVQGQHAAHLIQSLIGDTPTLIWADDAQWSPEGQILKILNRLDDPMALCNCSLSQVFVRVTGQR